MRLIDVERLEKDLIELYEEEGWNKYEIHFSLQDVISNHWGRTVKAIPIEWIEEWGWKNGMSESMSLRVMIDDWEKENEERTNA